MTSYDIFLIYMAIYAAISQAAIHSSIPLDLVLSQDILHSEFRKRGEKGRFYFFMQKMGRAEPEIWYRLCADSDSSFLRQYFPLVKGLESIQW